MATIGNVSIDLEARLAKFESDFGRAARIAEREMERMRRQISAKLSQINDQMTKWSRNLEGAVKGALAAFSVGAVVGFSKNLINVADNINDLSKKFGISTEALSTWRLVAEKSGTDLDGVGKAAKFLT